METEHWKQSTCHLSAVAHDDRRLWYVIWFPFLRRQWPVLDHLSDKRTSLKVAEVVETLMRLFANLYFTRDAARNSADSAITALGIRQQFKITELH